MFVVARTWRRASMYLLKSLPWPHVPWPVRCFTCRRAMAAVLAALEYWPHVLALREVLDSLLRAEFRADPRSLVPSWLSAGSGLDLLIADATETRKPQLSCATQVADIVAST